MITKERALQALEDMDDFAKMDIGVDPIGAYNVLKAYIEQTAKLLDTAGYDNDYFTS